MKTLKYTFIMLVIAASFSACKNADINPAALGGVYVANTVIGGDILAFNGNTGSTVSNNSYGYFDFIAGQSPWKLATTSTPSVAYYNQTQSTSNGDYFSLFLSGTSATSVDAVLVKESFKNYKDSVCGVRFVNMMPGNTAISVNISGQANGSEVTTLGYKAYSTIKQYAAKKVNASYVFQVRDVTTGNLITSYTLATPYFRNVSIVLRGIVGGSPAPGVTLVSYN